MRYPVRCPAASASAWPSPVRCRSTLTPSLLTKQLGLAMVFISHDIQTVRYISDRIIVMNHGQAVEQGTAEEVFNHPKDDYTRLLLGAAPSLLHPNLGKE